MDTSHTAHISADAGTQAELVRLLSQHFGDGLVYIAEESDHRLLTEAKVYGLVSADGQLTAAGYRLLRRGLRD